MKILENSKIEQKIRRLSIEILENNYGEKSLILAGINNNGTHFAKLLIKELKKLTDIPISLAKLSLNPANPLESEIQIDLEKKDLKNKVVIIVDDVANTGRTIFYAMQPLLQTLPKKVEVAVLVDRQHKQFPIGVDYVGLSLATTLKENIQVDIKKAKEKSVILT